MDNYSSSIEPLNNRIQQLERRLEVGRNLSAMLDLDPLLQTIIDAAADLTYSQESSILLYDEKEENLRFVAAPWFKRDLMKEIKVPLDKSIAGQVFKFGEPIMVQDAEKDPRIFRDVDNHAAFETQSLLAVPMIFKGKPTGVLTAVNKMSKGQFTEEDIHILEHLAADPRGSVKRHSGATPFDARYELTDPTEQDGQAVPGGKHHSPVHSKD